MEKWEYNTEIVELASDEYLTRKMNEFGEQGWEIFNVEFLPPSLAKDRFSNSNKLLMKRKKHEE